MSEYNFKLTGWKAVAVLVFLAGVFGFRLMTFNDMQSDKTLMKEIKVLLMCDYYPDEAERLKAVYETGDDEDVEDVAESITSTKANVDSLQASYPFFNLSARKDVVIKVIYSLNDVSGTRETRTKYYLFKHGSLGNIWQYQYETGSIKYYLNFL